MIFVNIMLHERWSLIINKSGKYRDIEGISKFNIITYRKREKEIGYFHYEWYYTIV